MFSKAYIVSEIWYTLRDTRYETSLIAWSRSTNESHRGKYFVPKFTERYDIIGGQFFSLYTLTRTWVSTRWWEKTQLGFYRLDRWNLRLEILARGYEDDAIEIQQIWALLPSGLSQFQRLTKTFGSTSPQPNLLIKKCSIFFEDEAIRWSWDQPENYWRCS